MLRTLLCAIAMLPCLLRGQAYQWEGYLYEHGLETYTGHAIISDHPSGRCYGRFRLYYDSRFEYIFTERMPRNYYVGFWRNWNLNEGIPITSWWLDWLGYRYWIFQLENKTYFGLMSQSQ